MRLSLSIHSGMCIVCRIAFKQTFIYSNLFEFITLFYCLSSAMYPSRISSRLPFTMHLNWVIARTENEEKGEKERTGKLRESAMIRTVFKQNIIEWKRREQQIIGKHIFVVCFCLFVWLESIQRDDEKCNWFLNVLSMVSNKYNNFMSSGTLYTHS